MSDQANAYAHHLQTTVLPALEGVREVLSVLDADIKDYEQVARRLERIEQDGNRPRTAPTELGAGVWVDAVVPDPSTVTLDLGLDLHMSLPAKDAAAYALKRADVLRKKRAAVAGREERLKWEVSQFEGAIGEAEARALQQSS